MLTAGVLAGLIAAGIGGVAAAQSGGTTVVSQIDGDADSSTVVFGGSPEDEAIWEQFDQCLVDAGVDFDALEAAESAGTLTEVDEDRVDAAFESCESVLENLSEDEFAAFDMDLSAEDEAVFDQFDQCLVDAGVDIDDDATFMAIVEIDEAEMDKLDAAFESCEPILDNLSEDMKMFEAEMFEGDFEHGAFVDVEAGDWDMEMSAEDEALFNQYDQCLTDAGVDFDALDAAFEAGTVTEVDEDKLDAAFDSCEPILDDLSGDVMMGEMHIDD